MKGIGMKNFSGISVAAALLAVATLAGCPQPVADKHSQEFAAGDAATSLAGKQLYYMPDGRISFYSRTVQDQATLPTATTGHTVVDFAVAGSNVVTLPAGSEVMYYGVAYDSMVIGSDGTIAFGGAGTGNASVTAHFSSNQVSVLPVDATGSGQVSYQVAANAVTVTYEGVDGSTAQSEFFISGDMDQDIAISYPTVSANAAGVVGLSRGQLAGANASELADFLAEFGNGSNLGTSNTGAL